MSIGIIRNVTRDTFENPDTLNSKNADSPHLRPAFCFFSCQSYDNRYNGGDGKRIIEGAESPFYIFTSTREQQVVLPE